MFLGVENIYKTNESNVILVHYFRRASISTAWECEIVFIAYRAYLITTFQEQAV